MGDGSVHGFHSDAKANEGTEATLGHNFVCTCVSVCECVCAGCFFVFFISFACTRAVVRSVVHMHD